MRESSEWCMHHSATGRMRPVGLLRMCRSQLPHASGRVS